MMIGGGGVNRDTHQSYTLERSPRNAYEFVFSVLTTGRKVTPEVKICVLVGGVGVGWGWGSGCTVACSAEHLDHLFWLTRAYFAGPLGGGSSSVTGPALPCPRPANIMTDEAAMGLNVPDYISMIRVYLAVILNQDFNASCAHLVVVAPRRAITSIMQSKRNIIKDFLVCGRCIVTCIMPFSGLLHLKDESGQMHSGCPGLV